MQTPLRLLVLVAATLASFAACAPLQPLVVREGYLVAYRPADAPLAVRYSADGTTWTTGDTPDDFPATGQFGLGTEPRTGMNLLVARDGEAVRTWAGLGAAAWEEQRDVVRGTPPGAGGRFAVAPAGVDRWVVAYRNAAAGDLVVRLYDSRNNEWIGGNLAPANQPLTRALLEDPAASGFAGNVLLAWRTGSGALVTMLGAVPAGGTPNFGAPVLLDEADVPRATGAPRVAHDGSRFLVGYPGLMPAPGNGPGIASVVVLRQDDDVPFAPYAADRVQGSGTLELLGLGGRSDGGVVALRFHPSQGATASRFAPPQTWTSLGGSIFTPPLDAPFAVAFVNTGRPPPAPAP